MIKIENTILPSPSQWQIIINGMRNPMNSWDKSDSYITQIEDPETLETADYNFFIGDADRELMLKLATAGPVHAKYRRMITVLTEITAPLYWWKEFDTYKLGTVSNSCSTMHKIHAKKFVLDDFSIEHLEDSSLECIKMTIKILNFFRANYLETKSKNDWWQMIQLLPSSYNQKRTIMLNYEVLHNIFNSRRNHKLHEWHIFCDWICNLPYSELITEVKND